MKAEAIGEKLILNGEIYGIETEELFDKIESPPIYEVIRVIDGIPLFFEEHLERMIQSAQIMKSNLTRNEEEIRRDIISLILANKIKNTNIKLISTEINGLGRVLMIYELESFYPPINYYTDGIHTILVDYERENPNAKVYLSTFKQTIKDELEREAAFEALLVNKAGRIVEGSRSNIFFAYNDKIYTSAGSDVLLGITRSHILEICKDLKIEVVEENLDIKDISKIDGAFMTGTSVNVLPISSIGKKKVNSINSKIIIEISKNYILEMENYLQSNKEIWTLK